MTEVRVDFLLVIPAYREHFRLPAFLTPLAEELRCLPFTTVIQVVDDGSPRDERTLLSQAVVCGKYGSCSVLPPIFLPSNQGKGAAILEGWRKGHPSRWIAFVDADGAISAPEVRRVLEMAFQAEREQLCLFGSRIRMLGRKVERRFFRHVCGRVFATMVGALLDERVYDSQCGFKILPRSWFLKVDGQLMERGFCFDVELLLALRESGAPIVEVPVDWEDKDGGSVGILSHGWRMMAQLWKLRARFKDAR